MCATKKKPKVKKRIPLPLKPPKVEPKPNAYDRKPKHRKDWQGIDDAPEQTGREH